MIVLRGRSTFEAGSNRAQDDERRLEVFGLHELFDRLLPTPKSPLEALCEPQALLGGPQNRGPMVVRIRLEANEPRLSEQIRDALYALAGNPHSARDLGNGSTGADGDQNLPAGTGLFLQLGGLLSPKLVEAG